VVEPVVFRVRLKVLTSLAVLNGSSSDLFDYFPDPEGKVVRFVNFRALADLSSPEEERLLDELLEFLKGFNGTAGEVEKLHSLYARLPERVTLPVKAEEGLVKDLKKKLRSGKGSYPVKRIYRDPCSGLPYVPGSSFKGALRTALLERFVDLKGLAKGFKKPIEKSAGKFFSEVEKNFRCRSKEKFNSFLTQPRGIP